jgi:hypothetical protein
VEVTAGISGVSFRFRLLVVQRKLSGRAEAGVSLAFTGESSLGNIQSNFYTEVEKIIHLSTVLCFQNCLKKTKVKVPRFLIKTAPYTSTNFKIN